MVANFAKLPELLTKTVLRRCDVLGTQNRRSCVARGT